MVDSSLDSVERLGRVDVDQDRVVVAGHLAHLIGVLADQVAGAGVAGHRGHLGEEAARPEHRVAALAAMRRQADGGALRRREGVDQRVDQRAGHARHVAQADDGAVDVVWQRGEAGPQRGAEPFGVVGAVDEFGAAIGQRRADLRRLVAGD